MSREIKFRGWLVEQHKWAQSVVCYSDFDPPERIAHPFDQTGVLTVHHPTGGATEYYVHAYSGGLIVEQYTGLKDKNGKEIYEGDIIAQSLVDDPSSESCPTYVVRWDEELLEWALKDTMGDEDNDTDLSFFKTEGYKGEVIGNIHENPELLESVK